MLFFVVWVRLLLCCLRHCLRNAYAATVGAYAAHPFEGVPTQAQRPHKAKYVWFDFEIFTGSFARRNVLEIMVSPIKPSERTVVICCDLPVFTRYFLHTHTHTHARTLKPHQFQEGMSQDLFSSISHWCKLATAGCTPHTPHHGRCLACKLPTCGWMISWWSYFVLFLNFESQYVPLFLSPKSRCVKYITRRYYYSLTFTNLKCCIRDEFPY